jgi:hypothetical protein
VMYNANNQNPLHNSISINATNFHLINVTSASGLSIVDYRPRFSLTIAHFKMRLGSDGEPPPFTSIH